MNIERFMTTVMCDDVRREEGNKLSYLGIYSGSIIVPDFPVTLPKLCFVASLSCPGHQELPKSLKFLVLKNEEIMAEVVISEAVLENVRRQCESVDESDSKRLTIGTVFQIFPLQLAEECLLKARAICDEEEIKGGSWPVERVRKA